MNRPSSFEDRLTAWLEEGPTSGPDQVLASAHARARSIDQRPAWWLALRGTTMETTWRARPMLPARLAFILLTGMLLVALVATALIVGSRLISTRPSTDGRAVVAPQIPTGPDALLAFTSWSSEETAGDLYVVRADGTDGRRLTADELDDWSPAWSPDGSEIAVYSQDLNSIQLRVISPEGIRVLDDSLGCFQSPQQPAWSSDGRYIAYSVDRLPGDGVCEIANTDVFVVPADGSTPGRRVLAASQTEFTTMPDWSGSRIAMAANDTGVPGGRGSLLVVDVTDPEQPWGLAAHRVDTGYPDFISFGFSRWSPDGSAIATTYIPSGTGFGTAVVYDMDGSAARSLMDDPTKDQIWPDWSPDGTWLTMLELTELLSDHGVYHLVVVGRDGSEPRIIETPELNGNAGPAMISPDGTLAAAREETDGTATPGAVLIVPLAGQGEQVRIPAGQWSSLSWQPVVNPDNLAAHAPEGLPGI
jgi:Tol biopolymer transport system component